MNNKLLWILLTFLSIVLLSCENIVEPEILTTISFKINRSGSTNGSISSAVNQSADLRIICIDATMYSDSVEFVNDLIVSFILTAEIYPELSDIETDSIQAYYDYLNLFLEKKVSGNFVKDFEVNVDLNTEDSIEVFVHPGLNVFVYFLMDNSTIISEGSIFSKIIENQDNIIELSL